MKPVLTLPKSTSAQDVKAAQDAGYIVIRTSRPDAVTVKVPIPNLEMSGNDVIEAAAIALCAGDTPESDQRRTVFVRHLFGRINARLKSAKGGAQ